MRSTYDFIVVGAGSSGCAVAARLAASGRFSVLLLEAGPSDFHPFLRVPIGYAKTIRDSRVNWCYQTEPEVQLGGRRIEWPRGRVLGGSSSINALVHVRGHRTDYDEWAQQGCAGWDWNSVNKYFKRQETTTFPSGQHRGKDGPVYVSLPTDRHTLCEAFLRACEETGIPIAADYNDGELSGAAYFQVNTKRGYRSSASQAYLRDLRVRARPVVLTHARVSKIIFNGKKAKGVAFFTAEGALREANALREVILSAGTIGSPHVLVASGIGPRETLLRLGIPVLVNAPQVGSNLQDHFGVRLVYKCRVPITWNEELGSSWGRAKAALRFALTGRGPFAVSSSQATAFMNTRPDVRAPDMQVHFMTYSSEKVGTSFHSFPGFTASVCGLRPRSRGALQFETASTDSAPKIRANYLAHPDDMTDLVAGFELLRRVVHTDALAPFSGDQINTAAPSSS